MTTRALAPFILCAGLLCAASAAAGHVQALASLPDAVPVRTVPDTRSVLPVVQITGVRGATVRGTISGDVRLVSPLGSAQSDTAGSFQLAVPTATRQELRIPLPAGMQYFASRKGKVYYSVKGKAGSTVLPENRVYFGTKQQAEAAGYHASR